MEKFKKTIFLSLLLFIVLLALDILGKYVFYTIDCCSQLALFEKVFNTGISWGISLPSLLTIVISFVALGVFGRMYRRKYFGWVVFAFLVAGTLWNLIDRLFLGGVRDFIQIGNFPVFNLADVWLNVWVGLFVLMEIRTWFKHKRW